MRRPSRAGLLVGLALAVPILIELRTVLVWLGFDVPFAVYLPITLVGLAAVVVGLWVFGEENPNSA